MGLGDEEVVIGFLMGLWGSIFLAWPGEDG